jgi:hypothetical protein
VFRVSPAPLNAFFYLTGVLRPALPVPRPGRDREARHFWNTVWSLQHFVSKLFVLMLCMPACPGATAFEPESCYGETTKTLSKNLIIRNPGLGQGIPVYPG